MTEVVKWKQPCGCWLDATRYHKMCAKHEADWQEIHDRWAADKIRMDKAKAERELLKVT